VVEAAEEERGQVKDDQDLNPVEIIALIVFLVLLGTTIP
jgi:hypothetical protein